MCILKRNFNDKAKIILYLFFSIIIPALVRHYSINLNSPLEDHSPRRILFHRIWDGVVFMINAILI